VTLHDVARAQIAYWTATAIWPLVHMGSFQRVTGRKRDGWLVRTVSTLILSIVATLAAMDRGRADPASARVLGVTSTAALGSVSLIGPLVRRISPLYLVDALVELALCALWIASPRRWR